jgi:acyl-CoA synthetase (AMP-forming)/AMP-acid ligase II
MLVQDFLEQTARTLPGKTALVCGSDRFTYAQLDESANRLANALVARGLGRGDRVAIYLDNRAEAVIALFAALKADAAFVILNRTIKPEKLAFLLAHCQAKILVTDSRALSSHAQVLEACPDLAYVIFVTDRSHPVTARVHAEAWSDALGSHGPTRPERKSIDLDLAFLTHIPHIDFGNRPEFPPVGGRWPQDVAR